MAKKANPWLITAAAVIIVLALSGGFDQLQSIIGEEGFADYDPLLTSGSYTPLLWEVDAHEVVREGIGQLTFEGRDVCTNCGTSSCDPIPGMGAYGCSMVPLCSGCSSCSVVCQAYGFRTENLYQKNFKAEFNGYRPYSSRFNNYPGAGSVGIRTGSTSASYGLPDSTDGSVNSDMHGVEIRWDNYETGAFAFLVDGIVQYEGVAENEELYFTVNPAPRANYKLIGELTVYNPRIKELFGCDPQGGELLASILIKGPAGINTNVLPGFRRFCVDHGTVFLDAGISGTRGPGPYYAMASGETVVLETNQAEMYFYLASMDDLGITQQCEIGAYDVTSEQCQEMTGIINLCPVGQQQSDGSCLVFVENEFDIDDRLELAGNRRVVWNANHFRQDFRSGSTKLLSAEAPDYLSLQECRVADPELGDNDAVFYYPGPSNACWRLELNNIVVAQTGTTTIESLWSVTPRAVLARIEYNSDDGLFYDYRELDDWQITYEAELVGDPFVITGENSASEYGLGVNEEYFLTVQNTLSGSLDTVIQVRYTPAIIADEVVVTKNLGLTGTQQIPISAFTGYTGTINARAQVFLDTDAGLVEASQPLTYSYSVKGELSCPTGSDWNAQEQQCEYEATAVCPAGTTFNEATDECEKAATVSTDCPTGFTHDQDAGKCVLPVENACPANTYYNPTEQKCILPLGTIDTDSSDEPFFGDVDQETLLWIVGGVVAFLVALRFLG